MTKRHPLLDVSLSDHFSVHATLKLEASPSNPQSGLGAPANPCAQGGTRPSPADDAITVDDCIVRSGAFLHTTNSPSASEVNLPDAASGHQGRPHQSHHIPISVSPADSQLGFSSSSYDEVLAAIRRYRARELRQRRWRAVHFFASLFIGAACLVGLCFSPHNWVAFILALVAVVSVAAGCIDGLLALLFFNAELRAMSEFEWEIEHARASALSIGGATAALTLPPVSRDDDGGREGQK
jgi:sphingomyelin phosphodiesterase 2